MAQNLEQRAYYYLRQLIEIRDEIELQEAHREYIYAEIKSFLKELPPVE